MIIEDQVVEAYRKKLRLTAERDVDTETPAQFETLLDAREAFEMLELHYLAQEAT